MLFLIRLVSVHVVHPYSSMDTTAVWRILRFFYFILSDRSDFHKTDNLSIAVHTFTSRVLMSISVDEMLLPRLVNLFTSFKEPPEEHIICMKSCYNKNCLREVVIVLKLLLLLLLFTPFVSVSRWFFTGVWMTASLLTSPGLVLGFWSFSAMCHFG